jgi:hypothetical protein
MANTFLYGPYVWVSEDGAPPGTVHLWTWGPWPWYANEVIVTAHPFALAGANRQVEVTSQNMQAAPDGNRYLHANVHIIGPDWTNYAVWLGGVSP